MDNHPDSTHCQQAQNIIPQYDICGINIWGFRDSEQFLAYLFAGESIRTGIMVAINAEKVMTAEENMSLRQLIGDAEYKYADGISISRAIKCKYPGAQVSRIAGADFWELLMERAGQKLIPVFLIGSTAKVLTATKAKLRQQWHVNIVGSQDGYFSAEQRPELFERIRTSGAKIVTVAMGSPKQELLMHDCKKFYPDALYMGVGGTYDAFVGQVKRAPKVWRNWGLEWLYRLLLQPTRWQRQLKLLKFLFYYYNRRL